MGHWRIMNIEQGISNYEPDIKTSSFRIRLSRISCPLSSAGISSPLGNYVTIRRTRHSGRREATVRNPVKVQYNQILSGSRLAPAAAGLGRDDYLRRNHLGKDENSSAKGFIADAVTRPKGGSLKDNFEIPNWNFSLCPMPLKQRTTDY